MDKDTIWEAQVSDDPGEPDDPQSVAWDDEERRTMLCRRCHLPRVFRRRKVHHSLHFLLALITYGLWLPIWGINILLQLQKPWTCSVCGVNRRDK